MGKIVNILKIVIGIIAAILFVRIMIEDDELIKEQVDLQNSLVSPDLYLAYIILGIAVLLAVVFTLIGVFKGNIKKTLISVGAFVVVVLISYFALAGDYGMGFEISDTETLSKNGAYWVGAGLYTFYILAAVAIGSMLVSTVKKATIK
jgi:hypothetical protein